MPIHRRDALKLLATAPLVAGQVRAKVGGGAAPNIVFILTDDQRYDAFGFMQPWLPTPNLDRIAREGAHLRNAFVTTSLCSPSRASLLTGQYASRHGVQNNVTPWRDSNVSFLELLKHTGYRVGFIGKWHMPGKGLPDLVGQGKVDRMVSFTAVGGQGQYIDCPLVIDGQPVPGHGYITDVLTGYALDFMRSAADHPFCLYLSHKAVHDDFVPPEKYKGSLAGAPFHKLNPFERRLPIGAYHVLREMGFKQNQEHYFETLRGVDDSVGEVLKYLDEQGLAQNTIVVYAGDNGFFWGEHGMIDKRYAYEESMRIPLLLRWPAGCAAGTKVDEMTLNIDLAPTLLSAAGLVVPANMQGQSWLPLLGGPVAPGSFRERFLYEYFRDPGWAHPAVRAVRTRDWKLITYPGSRFGDELYNIAADPSEAKNLIADPAQSARQQELRAELTRLERAAV